MKIKLDENLPVRLRHVLSAQGHEVDTVVEERLTGQLDQIIWQAAQSEKRFLITQDLDFSDIRIFAPGTHSGILLVRLRDPSARALLDRVSGIADKLSVWEGYFVVLTEHKLRIKRPS